MISLLESVEICIIGMILVCLFLSCMIGIMKLSYKTIDTYFKDNEDNRAVIAAIVASIQNK